jgi:ribonuclease HI
MIKQYCTGETDQPIKYKIRRSGPLDAYIYQKGGDDANVEQGQESVVVHPTLPPTILTPINEPGSNVNLVHIFTDGACTNNGKRGANAAWGYIVVADNGYKVLDRGSGPIIKSEQQTNQRAELMALLMGLEAANKYPGSIKMWSDSQYAINCASVWGPSWRKKGWTKQGGPIQHLDLVKQLVEKTGQMGFRLKYQWLKGHKGGGAQNQFPWMFNHQVDALATAALV